MAEAVLLAVSKIGSALVDEATKAAIAKLSEKVKNLKELPEKVEEIKNELKMMNNVIKQISIAHLTNEVVKGWIAEVRELAYRVEDVMDRYSYHAVQMEEERTVKKFLHKAHYVTIFSEIAEEIIQIEKKIQNVVKRKDRWLMSSQLSFSNTVASIERKRSQDRLPDVIQDDLVGIEENRRHLTEWLYSDEPNSTVITVWGMGGLGKTTLVTDVYERDKEKFTAYAWIAVSQTYDLADLLRKLLRKIGYQEQTQLAELEAIDLKEKIKEKLKDVKCLIVLDDVWKQEAYNQIRDALPNLQDCRIIITTRQEQVATLAHQTRRLKMQPLEHDDAFDLFCKKAFFNSMDCKCPQELEKLAKSIMDRCQGLPLAIVSAGGLFSSLPYRIWDETYKQLRGELASNDHIQAILNLSYHDLTGDLRNCFLYCSLFPEDYPMSRESLVRLWVAEGFAVGTEHNTPEGVAERYLRELIQRNMLEVVESDEMGRVSACKMHDLVRDLAISIAKEEKFGFANDSRTMAKLDKDIRRLSSSGWKDNSLLGVQAKFPRLRTLLSLGITASSPHLLSSVFPESSYLTVLELQDSEIAEVPESIGNLFNLRYIGLRRTRVKSLPESIGKLSNLHTLDIKQTKIEKLPRGIERIKKLRHLLADRYADEKQSEFRYFIGMQAPKDLSNMEELQTLETVQASKDLAEQLKKLLQLRSLWIDNINAADCVTLFATLSRMPLLSSLLLSAKDENEELCFEALKPMSKHLHKLIIRGQCAWGTLECPIFKGYGEHLKYLALSWCHLGGNPLENLASHLPKLTYLRLNNLHSAEVLVLPEGSFPLLKILVLKQMPDVKKLVITDGALARIEGLYIVSLSELDKVPQGIEFLRSLKKLWLLGLHKDFRTQWDKNEMHQKMLYVPEVRL